MSILECSKATAKYHNQWDHFHFSFRSFSNSLCSFLLVITYWLDKVQSSRVCRGSKITEEYIKFPKKQDVWDSCASKVLVKLQEVKSWITNIDHSSPVQTAGADYIHIPPIKHFLCSLGWQKLTADIIYSRSNLHKMTHGIVDCSQSSLFKT